MPFEIKTGVRAVATVGLTVLIPVSQLAHNPIYSQPDPVPLLAQAAGTSSISAITPQLAYGAFVCGMGTASRNIPNFPTANSLATIDKSTVTKCPSETYSVTRITLTDIVTPIWKPGNVRHIHDPEWRTYWLSIQRFSDTYGIGRSEKLPRKLG